MYTIKDLYNGYDVIIQGDFNLDYKLKCLIRDYDFFVEMIDDGELYKKSINKNLKVLEELKEYGVTKLDIRKV